MHCRINLDGIKKILKNEPTIVIITGNTASIAVKFLKMSDVNWCVHNAAFIIPARNHNL